MVNSIVVETRASRRCRLSFACGRRDGPYTHACFCFLLQEEGEAGTSVGGALADYLKEQAAADSGATIVVADVMWDNVRFDEVEKIEHLLALTGPPAASQRKEDLLNATTAAPASNGVVVASGSSHSSKNTESSGGIEGDATKAQSQAHALVSTLTPTSPTAVVAKPPLSSSSDETNSRAPSAAGSRPSTGGSRPSTGGSRPSTGGSRPSTARERRRAKLRAAEQAKLQESLKLAPIPGGKITPENWAQLASQLPDPLPSWFVRYIV